MLNEATTYILVEGPQKNYVISGHLTYKTRWSGNNKIIRLLGNINIKYLSCDEAE